jgi:hypothetical protein
MYFSCVALAFEDAEVSRPDFERMIDSNQVGVQGVVNDEPASGGSPLRFRGSGERVSLIRMGVYRLNQGAVVSRSVANGLGCSQVNVTTLPPLPLAVLVTCRVEQAPIISLDCNSRPEDYIIIGMDFEPVLATTTTESSDTELEAVGRLARGENSRSPVSRLIFILVKVCTWNSV